MLYPTVEGRVDGLETPAVQGPRRCGVTVLVILGLAYVAQCCILKAHPCPGLKQHPLLSRG